MLKMMRHIATCFALVLTAFGANAAPVIANGSFESGTTGWTFSGGAYLRADWGPGFDGASWAWVGRRDAPAALISQTVSGFTVGRTYTLSFLLASENLSYGNDTVNVAISGASTINKDFTTATGATCCWNGWEPKTYTFVADATSLTFEVHGYADGAFGHPSADAAVDKFVLAEVATIPTLSEWGMVFLVTLMVLGTFLLLRRKQS